MRILIAVLVLLSMLLLWGVLVEPRLIDEEAESVDLPNAWEVRKWRFSATSRSACGSATPGRPSAS